MLKLYVWSVATIWIFLRFILNFTLWQWLAYGPVGYRHKTNLVRVRDVISFWPTCSSGAPKNINSRYLRTFTQAPLLRMTFSSSKVIIYHDIFSFTQGWPFYNIGLHIFNLIWWHKLQKGGYDRNDKVNGSVVCRNTQSQHLNVSS